EIATVAVASAYDAIERLRPEFLRSRGGVSLEDARAALPVVYTDEMRLGGLGLSLSIRASDVRLNRLPTRSIATTRHGTGPPRGVIAVTTRRGHPSGGA